MNIQSEILESKKESNKKVSITAEEIAKDDIKLSEDISKIEN